MNNDITKQFASTAEAEIITGLNEKTIRTLVKKGELPGIRLGKKYLINLDALAKMSQPKSES